jgi:hypothetical protein
MTSLETLYNTDEEYGLFQHNFSTHVITNVLLYSTKLNANIRLTVESFVPTNALRQFFHCFLYYKDAPLRISAVILPPSGGILTEF